MNPVFLARIGVKAVDKAGVVSDEEQARIGIN